MECGLQVDLLLVLENWDDLILQVLDYSFFKIMDHCLK